MDLYGETKYYMVSAKQYDKSTRLISIALLNNGAEYKIPSNALLMVNVRKPDGKYVFNECTMQDNHVVVELTNQILAAAGTAYADIEIRSSDGSEVLSSASFTIEVEESMRNDTAIESSNEFTALDAQFEKLNASEVIRVANEDERKRAEAIRANSENERKNGEVNRQQQEATRQTETKKAIDKVNQAIIACEGIADGLNTMIDDHTKLAYRLGIENGNIYIKAVTI